MKGDCTMQTVLKENLKQIPEEKFLQQKLRPKKNLIVYIKSFVNSPYVFASIPLLAGSFYVALHPELITLAMNHPYAAASILALPVAFFLFKLIMNFFSVIEHWIKLQFEKAKEKNTSYFFELVIIVFMFVSVCEAGPFFNDIQHDVLGGFLGYVTVLAFDLIAVVCISARKKELAKGGNKSFIYLFGVIICAVVSMVANLYSALLNFQAPTAHTFPDLLKVSAPYVGIMFPIMIVFLAFSSDADVEIDDVDAYRKHEMKRVDFLMVRRDILEKVTVEMNRIETLRQHSFFLKQVFLTPNKIRAIESTVESNLQQFLTGSVDNLVEQAIDAKLYQVIETKVTDIQHSFIVKESELNEQLKTIDRLFADVKDLPRSATLQLNKVIAVQEEIKQMHADLPDRIKRHASLHIDAFKKEIKAEIEATIVQSALISFEKTMQQQLQLVRFDVQQQIESLNSQQQQHVVVQEIKQEEHPVEKHLAIEEQDIEEKKQEKNLRPDILVVNSKDVGYSSKDPNFLIGRIKFTHIALGVRSPELRHKKITRKSVEFLVNNNLIDGKYFRYIKSAAALSLAIAKSEQVRDILVNAIEKAERSQTVVEY